ncbi:MULTISPECIES: hypothetical protein [unclassified Streptomyces]|uniref:hypothetical protein n=1 Tax=unclassified Streptomyces TaxID=2593676 RepID=UPI002256B77C|nr:MULTISPECIES: hypothetical protein [unclassified Streptomyces]MCX4879841.1 hypothetical protein [Streptomyces sp. NBC_00847]MCX5419822.1 hypothetical protein [Streptomyces sp. NBC_00078]
MRLFRSLASVTVAVALVMSLPCEALPHARVQPGKPPSPQPFGAACRTKVTGSHVTTYCHNPYPQTDGVSLHVECARWWDIDTDGVRVDTGPAMTVRLTGRCWEEVRSVWISHQKR